MICREDCPRGTTCQPLSNVVADDGSSFVCVGKHGQTKAEYPQDVFRHCFFSPDTDSMFDYDHYDLLSVATVCNVALLTDQFETED